MKLYVLIAKVKPIYGDRENKAIKAILDHLIAHKVGGLIEIIGSELVEGDKSSCDIAITPVKVQP